MRWLGVAWLASCAIMATAGTAFGQVPDSSRRLPSTIVGRVVDTAGVVVADAEVLVTLAGDSAARTVASDANGEVVLSNLRPGGPYTILARKIGYGAARGTGFELQAGDTLRIEFVLPAVAFTLAPITVSTRSRLSIAANQFNARDYRDALDVIARHRRDMLGNPDECIPPNFNKPFLGIKLGSLVVGAGAVDEVAKLRMRPWLRHLEDMYDSTPVPYVRVVYINGLRFTGRPLWILRNIPADQIASIRYADCWDASVPLDMRYALYVVLKPSSPKVVDSIFDAVQAGGFARLYGTDASQMIPSCKKDRERRDDESCLVKLKPNREVYDSLRRALGRPDSS